MTEPTGTDAHALPRSALADAVVELIRRVHTPPVLNHSIRSYLFARLVAPRLGMVAAQDYDDELLFAACALHDLGVASDASGAQRFEVVGADRAAEFLTGRGVPAADVDTVWQAIALHTSPGIAERRGALCLLVREGVAVDFGLPLASAYVDGIGQADADAIHAAYPRHDMVRSLTDAIVAQAGKHADSAPPYSVPGEFLRERQHYGRTRLEHACRLSRWDN
jgi:hypothetical protein